MENNMKVLIIGSGGREHALAWKMAHSPHVTQVFVCPGNAGTAVEAKVQNVALDPLDFPALIQFVQQKAIELTIVGPEQPLAAGIVDAFEHHHLACFGPKQQAAQLEASKSFSKAFMMRHHIPTAQYASFTDRDQAQAYLKTQKLPIVIKADGLASGKGVVIAHSLSEAETAIDAMLKDHHFGTAGQQIVIEEFLQGEEASFIALVDGKHILPLATSQDHKAIGNGDQGPNTGGMGAYSPAPLITPALQQRIMDTIMLPTVNGLAAEGCPYVGFLYAGIMVTPEGEPKVLEYNCRLGDPETQPILLRLTSDLVTLCQAALTQQLDEITVTWDPRPALGVVLCAKGYPGSYPTGDVIFGLSDLHCDAGKVFHAGTAQIDGKTVTAGGRVLCVTALGDTIATAQQQAYTLVKKIHWDHQYYRTDIGYRAIDKSS